MDRNRDRGINRYKKYIEGGKQRQTQNIDRGINRYKKDIDGGKQRLPDIKRN